MLQSDDTPKGHLGRRYQCACRATFGRGGEAACVGYIILIDERYPTGSVHGLLLRPNSVASIHILTRHSPRGLIRLLLSRLFAPCQQAGYAVEEDPFNERPQPSWRERTLSGARGHLGGHLQNSSSRASIAKVMSAS